LLLFQSETGLAYFIKVNRLSKPRQRHPARLNENAGDFATIDRLEPFRHPRAGISCVFG
jgi:hypothetical protein